MSYQMIPYFYGWRLEFTELREQGVWGEATHTGEMSACARLTKSGNKGYSKENRHCCNFLWICFKNLIEFGKENLGNTLFDFVWICFKKHLWIRSWCFNFNAIKALLFPWISLKRRFPFPFFPWNMVLHITDLQSNN